MPANNQILLFDSNPPESDEAAQALFHNRKGELSWAARQLRAHLAATKILAIHGDTRTGKSHFARRMLFDATDALLGLSVIINANQRETAQNLLVDLFGELSVQLRGLDEWDRSHPILKGIFDDFVEFSSLVIPLIFGEVDQIELGVGRRLFSKASATMALTPTFTELGFTAEYGEETTASEKRILRAPRGSQLAVFCKWMGEAISELLGGPLLILVDDQDLLSTQSDGWAATSELVSALKFVAASPSIVVMATVRSAYWNGREKDLIDFVEVRPFGDADMKAVYQLRMDAYNDGEAVFSPTALRWLLDGADGRVGMFLQRCHQLNRRFYLRDGKVGVREIRTWIDEELDTLWRHPGEQQVLGKVYDEVRRGHIELQLSGDDLALLRRSKLWLHVLKPLPNAPDRCSIDPLYLEAIRDKVSASS